MKEYIIHYVLLKVDVTERSPPGFWSHARSADSSLLLLLMLVVCRQIDGGSPLKYYKLTIVDLIGVVFSV